MAELRSRRSAAGQKRISFFATVPAQDALARLRVAHPGKTLDAVLCDLLVRALPGDAIQGHPVTVEGSPGDPGQSHPVTIKPLPGDLPADRAALATIGHWLRDEGLTLAQVAERLNQAGYTPDKIPKRKGLRPRADSAAVWTIKSVNRLLSRDHPRR